MRRVLTPEMEKYFIENAFTESIKSMKNRFGVSDSVVKRVFKNHKIIIPKEVRKKFHSESLKGRTTFSSQESKFIQENYLTMPIKQIATTLNRSECGIKSRMNQLELVIPEELLKKRIQDGMFRKGQEPPNKGKKQTEYMSAEAIEKTKATRFKKGHISANRHKDFTEVLRKDKNGRKYWMIRLPGGGKMQYKHIWLWEQNNNRTIESGYNVVFKDGNSENCVIENLEYISDSELMSRNTLHNYPDEIRQLIQLKGAVARQINKHKKQQL
ncbi:MAG: HNH endonuclease signature motif containing protein [Flavobacteriaceae bacterium]